MSLRAAPIPRNVHWTGVLERRIPADVYEIAGITVIFQAADRTLRRLAGQNWEACRKPLVRPRTAHVVFRCPDRKPALRRLRHWSAFQDDHVVFLSDGKRYLAMASLYDHPWQIDCRALPDWDPSFVHYQVLEPILLDVLKKLGVVVWHSAAVERDGQAILLPGGSGSGKSTTTLNLLQLGYRFLADDTSVLRLAQDGVHVSGYEDHVFATDVSLRRLSEWRKYAAGRRFKRGRQLKHRINLTSFRAKAAGTPRARYLLFPSLTGSARTSLEQITPAEALVACLDQQPTQFPASILGPSVLSKQFDVYQRLVRSAACFRLRLGTDQQHVREVLSNLPLARS